MEYEMESLSRNQIWELVNLPKNSKTIGNEDNEQYMVILVAKGYAQKEGIDYNKIFLSCSQAYVYSDVIGDSHSF